MEVSGWGMYNPDLQKMSEVLQTVTLKGVHMTDCQNTFPAIFPESTRQICVGGKEGLDTCSGDSGGPLMTVEANPKPKYYLVGLVSFGATRCGMADRPAVYTSVARYMKWILHNITPC